MSLSVHLEGITTHNLKNWDISFPLGSKVWVHGVSGSGKSSFAVDSLYKAGRNQYLQILGESKLAQDIPIKRFSGLPPTLLLDGKPGAVSARSQVLSLLGIEKHWTSLWLHLSHWRCPHCDKQLQGQTLEDFFQWVIQQGDGKALRILAPLQEASLEELIEKGFVRLWTEGREVRLEELQSIPKGAFLVCDRIKLKESVRERLWQALELAQKWGQGEVEIVSADEVWKYSPKVSCPEHGGNFPALQESSLSRSNPLGACSKCQGLAIVEGEDCEECCSTGLSKDLLTLEWLSSSLREWASLDIESALKLLLKNQKKQVVLVSLFQELIDRFSLCLQLGLGYLPIFRLGNSLSSGEKQRLRLAQFLGQRLSGILLVMDEPFAGLSPVEIELLLPLLQRVVEQGNTLVLVENHACLQLFADLELELGPEGGSKGGRLLYSGVPRTSKTIPLEIVSFLPVKTSFELSVKAKRNVKDMTLALPKNTLLGISGVSGSGKSTLLFEMVVPALLAQNKKESIKTLPVRGAVLGQRSTINTYLKFSNKLREIFSLLPESKLRGYKATRFSANTPEGRCEKCTGKGKIRWSLAHLEDQWSLCSLCNGSGFQQSTLQILCKGQSIAEWNTLSVHKALSLSKNMQPLARLLEPLEELGLGYLSLGQDLKTLSDGELQRLRLAQLISSVRTPALVFLDEPCRGLHDSEVILVLRFFRKKIEEGWSFYVIEHKTSFLEQCPVQWEIGPGAGPEGGQIEVV